jgi:hypothetical protein
MSRKLKTEALTVSKTGDVKFRAGAQIPTVLTRLGWVERDPNVPSRWRAFDFRGSRITVGKKTRREAVEKLSEHAAETVLAPVQANEHVGTDDVSILPEPFRFTRWEKIAGGICGVLAVACITMLSFLPTLP